MANLVLFVLKWFSNLHKSYFSSLLVNSDFFYLKKDYKVSKIGN